MTKNALLKKLEVMLTTAEEERMWGQITLEVKDGKVDLLRKSTTEKLEDTTERPRANEQRNRY